MITKADWFGRSRDITLQAFVYEDVSPRYYRLFAVTGVADNFGPRLPQAGSVGLRGGMSCVVANVGTETFSVYQNQVIGEIVLLANLVTLAQDEAAEFSYSAASGEWRVKSLTAAVG